MKFARYLQDNQTVEWRKAYIDYKALKKIIKKINPQSPSPFARDDSDDDTDVDDETTGEAADGMILPEVDLGEATLSMKRGEGALGEEGEREAEELFASHQVGKAGSVRVSRGSSDVLLGEEGTTAMGGRYGSVGNSPRKTALAGGRDPAHDPQPLQPAVTSQTTNPPPQTAQNPPIARLTPAAALAVPSHPHPHPPPPAVPPATTTAASIPSDTLAPPKPSSDSPLNLKDSETSSLRPPSSPTRFFLPSPKLEAPDNSTSPTSPALPPSSQDASRQSLRSRTAASPRTNASNPRAPSPATAAERAVRERRPVLKGDPVSPVLGTTVPRTGMLAYVGKGKGNKSTNVVEAPHLKEIMPSLLPMEQKFLSAMDHELDKVESFYKAREAEMRHRVHTLQEQAKELVEHRRIFHQYHPTNPRNPLGPVHLPRGGFHPTNPASYATEHLRSIKSALVPPNQDPDFPSHPGGGGPNDGLTGGDPNENGTGLSDPRDQAYDPAAYKRYKRRLRAAVLECYRGLEILKNFRVLNLTGFRKALKKFEKASRIRVMEAYTTDRISLQTFSNSATVDALIEEMEALYAARFEHGDKKKAKERLRVSANVKSHHASIFRAGAYLGLSIFPFVHALVLSFQSDTRKAIPAWAALLQVFGAMYLAVIFSLAFYLNLWVWVTYRVNYRFIFELNLRTVLDYRQYLELPAFLFFTLSGCFWLAFARVGTSNVASTTWPLAWLVFCIVFLINPLPICYRDTRYWFLRCFGRVLSPFWSRIEFAAFFLADELNSLVFTIYNIWFLGCATRHDWKGDVYDHCNQYENWVPALLSVLPPLSRFLQCIQRWRDSGMRLHLINAGKYASTMVTFVCFFLWRLRGTDAHDRFFPVWCISAFITSVYTCSWDFLIDWSILQPHEKLLRKETVYVGKRGYIYFAILTNIAIRFIWIGYIPIGGLDLKVRGFIFAFLEVYRRWQWNMIRVENEHLGNADCYRVTRELPLPYELHDGDSSDEEETDDNGRSKKPSSVATRASSTNTPASLRLSRMVSMSRRSPSVLKKAGDEEDAVMAGDGTYRGY